MLQRHLSDQQFYCLLRCVLYSRFDGTSDLSMFIWLRMILGALLMNRQHDSKHPTRSRWISRCFRYFRSFESCTLTSENTSKNTNPRSGKYRNKMRQKCLFVSQHHSKISETFAPTLLAVDPSLFVVWVVTYFFQLRILRIVRFNIFRWRKNCHHFETTFSHSFSPIKLTNQIPVKYILRYSVINTPALLQIRTWSWADNRPLPEPMMAQVIDVFMYVSLGLNELIRNSIRKDRDWCLLIGFTDQRKLVSEHLIACRMTKLVVCHAISIKTKSLLFCKQISP